MSTVDSVLSRNANDLAKQLEVERIMKAFKLNPYDILDLPFGAPDADVKKQFRKKSLLIHPDKYKHEQGHEAFDFMKKAEGQLSEPSKRAEIDAIMTHSRTLVLKSILGTGYSTGIPDTDPRLANLTPPLDLQIRAKAKEVLIEDELSRRRKQKLTFANEGAEKAKQEAEVIARKRKVEDQAKWEGLSLRRYLPTALRSRRIPFPPLIVNYGQALTHDLLSPSSPSPFPIPDHLLSCRPSCAVLCCAAVWSLLFTLFLLSTPL